MFVQIGYFFTRFASKKVSWFLVVIGINNGVLNKKGQIQGIYKCREGDDFSRNSRLILENPW
jgi:hypothetical protein